MAARNVVRCGNLLRTAVSRNVRKGTIDGMISKTYVMISFFYHKMWFEYYESSKIRHYRVWKCCVYMLMMCGYFSLRLQLNDWNGSLICHIYCIEDWASNLQSVFFCNRCGRFRIEYSICTLQICHTCPNIHDEM